VTEHAAKLIAHSRILSESVSRLRFSDPVAAVYNPLDYARAGWEAYVELAAREPGAVFLGMNPGPWGMAQTGVPFGEVTAVREWMGIHAKIGSPGQPHPRRPITGFECTRSEVSGKRLWGLMRDRFGTADAFFRGHFVANYCPLVFMADSGRNITPDKLPAGERDPLFRACDEYLRRTLEVLAPRFAIGVGRFAESRIRAVAGDDGGIRIASILHPSPASPAANRGWASVATRQLVELGLWSD